MSSQKPAPNDLLAEFDSLDDVLDPITGNLEPFAPPELAPLRGKSELPPRAAEQAPAIRFVPGPTLDDRRRKYPDPAPPSMWSGPRVQGTTAEVLARFGFGGER